MKNELLKERLSEILSKDIEHESFVDSDIDVVLCKINSGENLHLEDLLAISIMFGYISCDKTQELDEAIMQYLNLKIESIVQDLDRIQCIRSHIPETSQNISFYNQIFSSDFNGSLIEDIVNATRIHLLGCIRGLYGLKHFLVDLLLTKSNAFDDWLKQSSRMDLKYVLLEELLCDMKFYFIDDGIFSSSKNPFIRCLYFFKHYHSKSLDESFDLIFDSHFTEDDQLYLSIFILLSHSLLLGENGFDLKFEKIKPLLDKIDSSGILKNLTKKSFNGFRISFFNKTISYLIIKMASDAETKKELLKWLYVSIMDNDFSNVTETSILLANVVISIANENPELYVDLKHKYKKICQETLFPYAYNRNPEKWYSNIMKQLFLTIVLCRIDSDQSTYYLSELAQARTKKHTSDILIDSYIRECESK